MTRRSGLIQRLVYVVTVLLMAAGVRADVPRQIHYQGKLRNSSGVPVDGAVSLRFRLYDNADGTGTPLFDETHGSVTVSNGLLSVLIGSQAGDVSDAALDAAEVYLGVSVNAGPELTPRPRIVSNPHAIKARSAEQFVKPGTFDAATTVDGSGNIDHVSDGATLRLPRKSTGGDPAGLDGMIYYNTADAKFRAHEGGTWGDMRGGGSSSGACPSCGEWVLHGVIDTGGVGGPIDISDNTKEYLIFWLYSGSQFTIGSAPLWAMASGPNSFETAAANPSGSNDDFNAYLLVRDTAGAWHPTRRAFGIQKDAKWEPATASEVLINHFDNVRVLGNGTVILIDYPPPDDLAVVVFSR